MPPRDPSLNQSDFPQLVADLIEQLKITGGVGLLDFDPTIRPVFIVGSRGLTIAAEQPSFQSAEVFSDSVVTPDANEVIVDTGQLAAGIFDVILTFGWHDMTANGQQQLQHRNAANNANLATWEFVSKNVIGMFNVVPLRFAYQVAEDERLRFVNIVNQTDGSSELAATLMATRRTVP